jgi:hypothetical protein
LKEFKRKRRGKAPKYNWDAFREKGVFEYEMQKGETYQSVSSSIRTNAKYIGYKVKIESWVRDGKDVLLVNRGEKYPEKDSVE